MDLALINLLQTSIELELNLSKMYRLFLEKLKQDIDFWWQLSVEEINHASLIRTGEIIPVNYFPKNILAKDVESLIEVNNKLLNVLRIYESKPIARVTAFSIALQFEEAAGEAHYQLAMTAESSDEWLGYYKRLNGGDINHRNRIKEYMKFSSMGVDEDKAAEANIDD